MTLFSCFIFSQILKGFHLKQTKVRRNKTFLSSIYWQLGMLPWPASCKKTSHCLDSCVPVVSTIATQKNWYCGLRYEMPKTGIEEFFSQDIQLCMLNSVLIFDLTRRVAVNRLSHSMLVSDAFTIASPLLF